MIRRPTRSTLFPSTPLFRSNDRTEVEFFAGEGVGHEKRKDIRLRRRRSERAATGKKMARARTCVGVILCLSFFRALRLQDRKSTRLNSSHGYISYVVFCL